MRLTSYPIVGWLGLLIALADGAFVPLLKHRVTIQTCQAIHTHPDGHLEPNNDHPSSSRREWLTAFGSTGGAASISSVLGGFPMLTNAEMGTLFKRETRDFAYSFVPPVGFETSQKPLKTHLDEVSFVSPDTKGYQIGITVDPVRINSLKQVRLGIVYDCCKSRMAHTSSKT